jgi:hypothetical protein
MYWNMNSTIKAAANVAEELEQSNEKSYTQKGKQLIKIKLGKSLTFWHRSFRFKF